MHAWAIFFGSVVGISLGLTGGGGGILAVPMLVYGVGIAAHQAILVSLIAVAATALFGAIERIRRGEVDVRLGVLFALAGIVAAPFGARIAHLISPQFLLILFSALMIAVAIRMWTKTARREGEAPAEPRAPVDANSTGASPSHAHTSHPVSGMMMVVLGLATGLLSGLFGVGGGFIIVPALVLATGMPIHTAVATSLLVIPLISISGIAMHLWELGELAVAATLLFVVGGIVGMWIGTTVGRRLSAAKLQKVFAMVIVAVAVFNLVMTLNKPTEQSRNDQITMTSK